MHFCILLCSECFRTSDCSWCKNDKNGNLVDGFCDLKEKCPLQQCLKNDCSKKCCGPECKQSQQSKGNVALIIIVAVGICLLIILIFVAVFIVRKQKSPGIDKHNTYIQPISEFDITYISTTENDFYHTTPTEQVSYHTIPEQGSYHTIPESHFDNTQEKCLYL